MVIREWNFYNVEILDYDSKLVSEWLIVLMKGKFFKYCLVMFL